MQLIKPSFIIIEQESGLEGMYKQIELAGRTCYKSEDKITKTSAKEFVDRMVKSGHGAMLEHGTVYLYIPYDREQEGNTYIWDDKTSRHYNPEVIKYQVNEHIKVHYDGNYNAYITTNFRVLVENAWMDDITLYRCEPESRHELRYTVKFTCDRGVTHEFVRHRVFSFAQESTRYCNYSKDKFGNEITFIIPSWLDLQEGTYEEKYLISKDTEEKYKTIGCSDIFYNVSSSPEGRFLEACVWSEYYYLDLLNTYNWKPQEARAVLPNALKAELVMTGFISDWEHFFYLRTPINAHPQARELAIPLLEEFKNRKYLK